MKDSAGDTSTRRPSTQPSLLVESSPSSARGKQLSSAGAVNGASYNPPSQTSAKNKTRFLEGSRQIDPPTTPDVTDHFPLPASAKPASRSPSSRPPSTARAATSQSTGGRPTSTAQQQFQQAQWARPAGSAGSARHASHSSRTASSLPKSRASAAVAQSNTSSRASSAYSDGMTRKTRVDSAAPTARFGTLRPTMLENKLLEKAPLGRSKGYYRHEDYTTVYGKPSPRPDATVDTLLHVEEKPSRRPQRKVVDHITTNKLAVRQGIISAKDSNRARRAGMAVVASSERERELRSQTLSGTMRRRCNTVSASSTGRKPFDHTTTFGKPSGSDPPIHSIIRHEAADEWARRQQLRDRRMRQQQLANRVTYSETRTSILRQKPVDDTPKPLWKMSKFSKARAKVDHTRPDFNVTI